MQNNRVNDFTKICAQGEPFVLRYNKLGKHLLSTELLLKKMSTKILLYQNMCLLRDHLVKDFHRHKINACSIIANESHKKRAPSPS